MLNKSKRVLWLLNHETLRNFEVPLLQRLGFEIYLPKIFPKTEENLSASVDYSFDEHLTIPTRVLELLNEHDFYSGNLSSKLKKHLNEYFNIAIFAHFPFLYDQVVNHFSGKIFLRLFGREANHNYESMLTPSISKNLHREENRFFFAQSYPFLSEVENGIYKRRAITLPLGIPENLMKEKNTWQGGNGQLLFVCPRIASALYYKNIYLEFKKYFSDIPHLIAGKQFEKHTDPAIQGNLPRTQYDDLLRSSEVMFYHSEEPRHLHYHPLEAVVFGLPLIYMRKGVLGRLTGYKDLPGACDSLGEAREKVSWILDENKMFIQEVLKTQTQLLDPFNQEYCERVWKKNFLGNLQLKPS